MAELIEALPTVLLEHSPYSLLLRFMPAFLYSQVLLALADT